jgi:hypothetical protein
VDASSASNVSETISAYTLHSDYQQLLLTKEERRVTQKPFQLERFFYMLTQRTILCLEIIEMFFNRYQIYRI